MRRGGSRRRFLGRSWLAMLGLGVFVLLAGGAQAAPIAVKLTATGVSPAARERFEAALRKALAGTRHDVVAAEKATYELSADVAQTGADSTFRLRLADPRAGRAVAERDGRCTGCDDAEAASRLQLTAESLVVAALETAAGQPLPASGADRGAGWARALPWVGLLGIAGASAAVHAHYKCRESAGQADACTVPLIGLTSVAVLSAALAVGTSLSLATGDSARASGEGASVPRWAPWVILLSGVAAGASGVGILTEDGYGRTGVKALGYASLVAGAAVAVTAVGTIATRPSAGSGAGQMAVQISPASVSLSARF